MSWSSGSLSHQCSSAATVLLQAVLPKRLQASKRHKIPIDLLLLACASGCSPQCLYAMPPRVKRASAAAALAAAQTSAVEGCEVRLEDLVRRSLLR
eukprot:17669-Heterococcus_DN1.PRE.2